MGLETNSTSDDKKNLGSIDSIIDIRYPTQTKIEDSSLKKFILNGIKADDLNKNGTNVDEYIKILSQKSIIKSEDLKGLIISVLAKSGEFSSNKDFKNEYEELKRIFGLLEDKITKDKDIGMSYNEFKDFIVDNLAKTQGLNDKILILLPSLLDPRIREAKEKEAELKKFEDTIFAYDKEK